ncbi:MAG: hypothetical protein HC897_05865 [Thermoanaerobaculia bacterium]|nr:hypothetical protein [Thermoanaerobaculia bacterium]
MALEDERLRRTKVATVSGGIFGGMRQVKATFFLPLRDNDDRDLSAEISEVEDECFALFGAWTLSGYFKGAWRMDGGERKIETSAAYVLILSDDRLGQLEDVLRRFKAKTTQEAIYLEIQREVDLRLV